MNDSSLLPGYIVLMPYPYTDYSNIKRRPALVLSTLHFNNSSSDVILAAISSNIYRKSPYEITVLSTHPDFPQTGLKCSSCIKCAKIFALRKDLIDRKLGVLPREFLTQVKEVLIQIFEMEIRK